MKRIFYTLLVSSALIMPVSAFGQSLEGQAIQTGQETRLIPVVTQQGGVVTTTDIVMSGPNLSTSSTEQIQKSLNERGYYPGPVTGKWDDNTAKALAAFQKSSGEDGPQDGMLIKASTMAKLNVVLKPTPEMSGREADARVSKDTSKMQITSGLVDRPRSRSTLGRALANNTATQLNGIAPAAGPSTPGKCAGL